MRFAENLAAALLKLAEEMAAVLLIAAMLVGVAWQWLSAVSEAGQTYGVVVVDNGRE